MLFLRCVIDVHMHIINITVILHVIRNFMTAKTGVLNLTPVGVVKDRTSQVLLE